VLVDELATVCNLERHVPVAYMLVVYTEDRHSRELRSRVDAQLDSGHF
jgi:hypothetical protein